VIQDVPDAAEVTSSASRPGALRTGRVLPLAALCAVTWVVFVAVGDGFLSSFNVNSLTQLVSQGVVIGLAQAVLMVLGRINLAVGGVGVTVVGVIGLLSTHTVLPLGVVLLTALAVGALAGALMAAVEFLSGLSSFVVTLAFLSVYQGGVLLATQATHYPISSSTLLTLGNGNFVSPYVSPLLVIALAAAALLWLVYFRTAVGWKSLAVGANERAAAVSGINVRRTVLFGYVLSGLLSGLAAVMETARLAEASPSTGGDWLLLSFIGPLLGGVALSGGRMSIGGILLGSAFYGSIFSGLVIMNVSTYWLTLAQALVLLAALLLGQLSGLRLPRRLVRGRDIRHA